MSNILNYERFAVIGDIHGEYDKLKEMFQIIQLKNKDIPIIITGDLIDRGPKSKEVVQFCIDNNIQSILGNHDDLLLDFLNGDDGAFIQHIYPGMKGLPTYTSYMPKETHKYPEKHRIMYRETFPATHQNYLSTMPLWKIIHTPTQSYFISHAGFNLTQDKILFTNEMFRNGTSYEGIDLINLEEEIRLNYLAEFLRDDIIWEHKRSKYIMPLKLNGKDLIQISGHFPFDEIVKESHSLQVDTGCGKGGKLSCLILPDMINLEVL